MKTIIEIADPLLRKAKERAARDGTTLRALMENALQNHLADPATPPRGMWKIKPFRGTGVRPGFEILDRDKINKIAYEDDGTG